MEGVEKSVDIRVPVPIAREQPTGTPPAGVGHPGTMSGAGPR